MTRRIDEEALSSRDLELITDYLVGELTPERVAEVRRRLDDDAAFRDFAAPIVAAWNVPANWERAAIDQGEVVSSWNRFTKVARFKHQRRKSRRRLFIIFGIIMAVVLALPVTIGVFALMQLGKVTDPMQVTRMLTQLSDSGQVMTLAHGTRVQLDPDAKLWPFTTSSNPASESVLLDGSAVFLAPIDSAALTRKRLFTVQTHGGAVMAFDAASIRVDTRGDTAELEVLPLPPGLAGERAVRSVGSLMSLSFRQAIGGGSLHLKPGERGRVVKGELPVKLATRSQAAPDPWDTVATGKRMAALQKSSGVADPLALWSALARPVGGTSPRLSSGVTVTLDRGARLRVLPDSVAVGPGRVVVIEGSASFTVPRLAPIGSERATIFVVLTRGGIVSVPGAASLKVSARGDTTEVVVLALPSDRATGRPSSAAGLVMLSAAGTTPAPTQLILSPGQSGRAVRGHAPTKLP